jgi:phenylacetate-CoA ligase
VKQTNERQKQPSLLAHFAEWGLRAYEEAGAVPIVSPGWLLDAVPAALSPGLIQGIQAIRLRRVVDLVTLHSPFYRDLLRRYGIDPKTIRVPADLVHLPFTTVEDLADPNNFRSVPSEQIAHIFTTSGTTADPKVVSFTARDLRRIVNLAAVVPNLLSRSGAERPRRVVAVIALPQGLWIGSQQAQRFVERSGGLALPIGMPRPDIALTLMRRFQPNTLITSPSYLGSLTRAAASADWRSTLRLIITGGEALSEEQRASIATSWGAVVLQTYGMTELGGAQAFALPGCRGLHLNEIHILAEIVDPVTGQRSEHGELVFTTLAREGMPLLRYRSGDLGSCVECGCGLPLRSFAIEGRIGDMFVAGDLNLYGRRIAEALQQVAGATGVVEIVLDKADHVDRLTLRVERRAGQEVHPIPVREAVLAIYPELRTSLEVGALEMSIEPVERLDLGAKAYRVIDHRRP